jgi:hypothetical protein
MVIVWNLTLKSRSNRKPWYRIISCIDRYKCPPLNVDSSNTTGPIHTWFVASERKFGWPHFSITKLDAGKYHDYVISHSKSILIRCKYNKHLEMIHLLVQELYHFKCFRFWPPGGQSDWTEIWSYLVVNSSSDYMKWSKGHVLTFSYIRDLDSVVIDRLNVIIDRLNVISSGSVHPCLSEVYPTTT